MSVATLTRVNRQDSPHLREKGGHYWWRTPHAKCMLVFNDDGVLDVWSVEVKKKHRGQGHGRVLMQTLAEYADQFGFRMWLSVYSNNDPAVRLYRSLGFEVRTSKEPGKWWVEYAEDNDLPAPPSIHYMVREVKS